MQASTLRPKFSQNSTLRNRIILVLTGTVILCAGCKRRDTISDTSGYVKLTELVHRHPGWQDVRQLDAMILHAAGLSGRQSASATRVTEVTLPESLQRRPLMPGAIAAEKKRIEAVQFPARQRIERLRNSANVRIDRAVSARQREMRSALNSELDRLERDLEEEHRLERVKIQSLSYISLRDLYLKEFALETQVATYRPYPTSPAYKVSVERLNEIKADREAMELKIAQQIESLESVMKQRLADDRTKVQTRYSRQIAEYRDELETAAAREVGARLASVETVIGSLEPLQRPSMPRAPETAFPSLPRPALLAGEVTSGGAERFNVDAPIAELRAQRERLAAYLEKDVRRRLGRLATQYRWKLAYGPTPGLNDMTSSAERLLVEEWTP